LERIDIPDSVTDIYGNVFRDCSNLTSITLPNRVNGIGASAFLGCVKLTNITIPDGLELISIETFWGSGLTSITIPDSVKTIDSNAFRSCTGLTSITIPNNVTSIGNGAFQDCTTLTRIIFNNPAPPTLGTSVVGATPNANLLIHVPAGSVSVYKGAGGNWTTAITNRIHAVTCPNIQIPCGVGCN
jgi:hypothetical protein